MKLSIPAAPRKAIAEALTAAGRSDLVRWLRAPVKAPRKQLVTRKAEKSAARVLAKEKTHAVWTAVMKRAANQCELCGGFFHPANWAEMDHLESGPDRKRLESTETCWAIHHLCHRHRTAEPMKFTAEVLKWAKRWGYPIPRRYR